MTSHTRLKLHVHLHRRLLISSNLNKKIPMILYRLKWPWNLCPKFCKFRSEDLGLAFLSGILSFRHQIAWKAFLRRSVVLRLKECRLWVSFRSWGIFCLACKYLIRWLVCLGYFGPWPQIMNLLYRYYARIAKCHLSGQFVEFFILSVFWFIRHFHMFWWNFGRLILLCLRAMSQALCKCFGLKITIR